MKLNALVVDLSPCSAPIGWDFLERVCGMLPGPRRDRLHAGLDRRPARPRPAPRRRRLDRQALPPRGGDGADRGRRAPPPPQPAQAPTSGPLVAGELEIRADQFQAFVAGRSLDLTRREFELLQVLADGQGR